MPNEHSTELEYRKCINRNTGKHGMVLYDPNYEGEAFIYSDKFSRIEGYSLPKRSEKEELHNYIQQNIEEIEGNLLQGVEESRYFIEELPDEYSDDFEVVDVLEGDRMVFEDLESGLTTLSERMSEEEFSHYNSISYGNRLEICDLGNPDAWLESTTVAEVQP